MSKKILKDLEIEAALQGIFGLPSNPEDSEDGEESDEEDVQYNNAKLQRILEKIDGPQSLPGLRSTIRSLTPSSKDSRSPTPSSIAAGSPAPSFKDAVSPTPSSKDAQSPTPSSKDAGSPTPSYKAAESPIMPSYVRKTRTSHGAGISLSSTNAGSLAVESQLSNRSPEASETENLEMARTGQKRGRGRNIVSGIRQRVGRGARRGSSRGRGQRNSMSRGRENSRRSTGATRRQREELSENDSSSESEEEEDNLLNSEESDADEDVWKKKSWTDRPQPQPNTFDQIPMRPKRILPANARPIRYFEKKFTDEVFELIVSQTNLYAEQQQIIDWTPVDGRELKAL